jgi:hypothetical protein
MKKIIIILITLFCFKTNAQMLTNDTGANISLILLLEEMVALNVQIGALQANTTEGNVTNADNKYENVLNKLVNEENLELAEDIEEAYWKVSDLLKNGKQINDIIDKGGKIYQTIEDIDNLTFNQPLDGTNVNLSNVLYGVLDSVDQLVDDGFEIVTDDAIKSDEVGRVTMLKYIEEKLDLISSKMFLIKKQINKKIRNKEYFEKQKLIKYEITND